MNWFKFVFMLMAFVGMESSALALSQYGMFDQPEYRHLHPKNDRYKGSGYSSRVRHYHRCGCRHQSYSRRRCRSKKRYSRRTYRKKHYRASGYDRPYKRSYRRKSYGYRPWSVDAHIGGHLGASVSDGYGKTVYAKAGADARLHASNRGFFLGAKAGAEIGSYDSNWITDGHNDYGDYGYQETRYREARYSGKPRGYRKSAYAYDSDVQADRPSTQQPQPPVPPTKEEQGKGDETTEETEKPAVPDAPTEKPDDDKAKGDQPIPPKEGEGDVERDSGKGEKRNDGYGSNMVCRLDAGANLRSERFLIFSQTSSYGYRGGHVICKTSSGKVLKKNICLGIEHGDFGIGISAKDFSVRAKTEWVSEDQLTGGYGLQGTDEQKADQFLRAFTSRYRATETSFGPDAHILGVVKGHAKAYVREDGGRKSAGASIGFSVSTFRNGDSGLADVSLAKSTKLSIYPPRGRDCAYNYDFDNYGGGYEETGYQRGRPGYEGYERGYEPEAPRPKYNSANK